MNTSQERTAQDFRDQAEFFRALAVVDSFQGRESYEQIMSDPSRYIVVPGASVPMLTA